MNYYAKSYKMDTLLIIFLLLGVGVILALSIAGPLERKANSPIEGGCGTENLRSRIQLLKRGSRFIAVIGDGVPGDVLVKERPYNTQFAQGYDLDQGVNHALAVPEFEDILTHLEVLHIDDGGNPLCAAKIAEIIATDPNLLGVIGHSTTSCTKEALPAYSRSKIPVIIPAATNPSLIKNHATHCFRLPSNDTIQSLVIADIVLTKFRAKRVFVVWDATPEAVQYSEFLKTTVQYHLNTLSNEPEATPIIEGSYPISLNPLNYTYLFRRIMSSDPDVIIFAGYGSLAREFLLGLDYEYSQHERIRPKVILTDGCKIPEINGYGFDTYITFAAEPLASFSTFATFKPGREMGQFRKMYLEQSYEVFGYDAAIMFLSAIKNLSEKGLPVSRKQVLRFIGNNTSMMPTSYPYTFSGGENIRNRYFCYSLSEGTVAFAYNETQINELRREAAQQ